MPKYTSVDSVPNIISKYLQEKLTNLQPKLKLRRTLLHCHGYKYIQTI